MADELEHVLGIILACFLAVGSYNVLELTVMIFATFKKWQGLYFYSLLAATGGIIPHNIGMVLKLYNLSSSMTLCNTLILTGWVGMVSGQSLVLYSRLHLLYLSTRGRARWVLYMIITDGIICHVPGFVLVFLGQSAAASSPVNMNFNTYEKIQLTIFFTQECIISSIYISKAFGLLRSGRNAIRGQHAKRLLQHLLVINVIIMALDLSLLGLQFSNQYQFETAYKSFVYSAKLKMEFAVLNDIMNLFRGGSTSSAGTYGTGSTATPGATTSHTSTTRQVLSKRPPYRGASGDISKSPRADSIASHGSRISLNDMSLDKPTAADHEQHPSIPLDPDVSDVVDKKCDDEEFGGLGIVASECREESKHDGVLRRPSIVDGGDEGFMRISSASSD